MTELSQCENISPSDIRHLRIRCQLTKGHDGKHSWEFVPYIKSDTS